MTDAQQNPENPPVEASAPDETSPIAALEAQVAQLKDQLLRTMADSENARRRLEKDKEESNKYAVAQFAKEMVQVADNLYRAIEAIPAEAREANPMLKNLYIGVEATQRQMQGGLEKFGVKAMAPMGAPFDPNFHQVMFESESDQPPGTVLQVMQAGYTISDRLLRPALVGVAKAKTSATDTKA